MKTIKLLIVEDHAVVRKGLRILLETAADMEVIGEAEDGVEAVRKTRRFHPDVVLMDLSLPLLDGMGATRQIHYEAPSTKVLVLSSYSGEAMVTKSIENGATGYLFKQSAANDLLIGIREVSQNR